MRCYGAQYYQMYRTDYPAMLHRLACTGPGARIRLGTIACGEQPDPGRCGRAEPRTHAQGGAQRGSYHRVKSTLKKAVTGLDGRATPSNDAMYHAVVSIGLTFENPQLRLFVETLETIVWMVPYRYLWTYCIASVSAERFLRSSDNRAGPAPVSKGANLVPFYSDVASVESWTEEADVTDFVALYDTVSFRNKYFELPAASGSSGVSCIKDCKLLPPWVWVHPKGLVPLGDASRPMLVCVPPSP